MKRLESVGTSMAATGLYTLLMLATGMEISAASGVAILVTGIVLMVIGIMGR